MSSEMVSVMGCGMISRLEIDILCRLLKKAEE